MAQFGVAHSNTNTISQYQVSYLSSQNQYITASINPGLELWDATTNKKIGPVSIDSLTRGTTISDTSKLQKFIDGELSGAGTLTGFQFLSKGHLTIIATSTQLLIINRAEQRSTVIDYRSPPMKSNISSINMDIASVLTLLVQKIIPLSGFITSTNLTQTNLLLIGDSNGLIRTYRTSGEIIKELSGQRQKSVSAVAWGKNSRTIYTGHLDNGFRRWDILKRTVSNQHQHRSTVNNIVISNQGNFKFSSSSDMPIFSLENDSKDEKSDLWGIDAMQWKVDSKPARFQNRNADSTTFFCCAATMSRDGSLIASQGIIKDLEKGQSIILMDAQNQQIKKILSIPYTVSIDSPDNTLFLMSRFMTSKFSLNDFIPLRGSSIRFSNDGSLVAAITALNTQIGIWETATGRVVQAIDSRLKGLQAIALSPDGKQLVAANVEGKILRWNLTNQEYEPISGHTSTITDLQYSPDGKTIASASEDKTIKLWDAITGQPLKTLQGHKNGINTIDFSPDGKLLLSGSDDNTTKIWDISASQELASLIPVDSTDWVVTSPDGLCDASQCAMQKMYFVQGLETFRLEQLKERYWNPGLLSMLLGYESNNLLPTPTDRIPLPPLVDMTVDKKHLILS